MVANFEVRFGYPAKGEKLTEDNLPGKFYQTLRIALPTGPAIPLGTFNFEDMLASVKEGVPAEHRMVGTILVRISYGDIVSGDADKRFHMTEFAYEYNKLLQTIERLPFENSYA